MIELKIWHFIRGIVYYYITYDGAKKERIVDVLRHKRMVFFQNGVGKGKRKDISISMAWHGLVFHCMGGIASVFECRVHDFRRLRGLIDK